MVAGLPIELVGNERERDVIGAVKPAHRFEDSASEPSVTRRIGGERRSKIRPGEIAGGRAQRLKAAIANRVRIAVPPMGGPRAPIRFSNASNRAPEVVMIFGFPNRHRSVPHRDVYQGQQTRKLNGGETSLVGNLDRELIVESRRRAQAWRGIVGPESPD